MVDERLYALIVKFIAKHQRDEVDFAEQLSVYGMKTLFEGTTERAKNHDEFLKFYMSEGLNQCKVPTWNEWCELKQLYETEMGVELQ